MTDVELNGSLDLDLKITKAALSSSSTRKRIERLHHIENHLLKEETTPDVYHALLYLLFPTYPYYQDRPSRKAVQSCLRCMLKSDTVPGRLFSFLQSETSKPGLAPSNAFVLVEWCSVILQETKKPSQWERWGTDTILSLSKALERCMRDSSRTSVKRAALNVTRRGLRSVLVQQSSVKQQAVQASIDQLCMKGNSPLARNTVLLGVIAGVCARDVEAKVIFEHKKSEYYNFFNREIIESRAIVSSHIASGLQDFLYNFSTQQEIEEQVIPALEKALLRTPEVVLHDLVRLFVESLPHNVDLSKVLQSKLLKPLLSSLKSKNPSIRHGALSAFESIILRCRDSKAVVQIAQEILAPLKAGNLSSADHRAHYADMIAVLPVLEPLVEIIGPVIAAVISKETSEAAIKSESNALLHFTESSIRLAMPVDKCILDIIVKGLSDKKFSIKRLWTLRIGNLLWHCTGSEMLSSYWDLAAVSVSILVEIWQEVLSNPVATAQSGLLPAAYVLVALQPKLSTSAETATKKALAKACISQFSLAMEPKPSFLLNPRIYGKLVAKDDQEWFLRALSALAEEISHNEPNTSTALAWSQAVIFCICSSTIDPTVQKSACQTLTRLYVQEPAKIGSILIAGIWQWRQCFESEEKDSATSYAKTGNNYLHLTIKSLCVSKSDLARLNAQIDGSILREQMVRLLVLAQSRIIPHVNWIDLCLRVGLDPGDFAKTYADQLLDQILSLTKFKPGALQSIAVKDTAFDAVAQLAFVAPSLVPRLLDIVQADLDPNQFKSIGPTEAAIYRTPDGSAFVDVLAKKLHNAVPNRHDKDYDTLKWEEDLRAQLALKKGQQKMLTAEEKLKVEAQLEKEASIRLAIQGLEAKVIRGIGILNSLATGSPIDASLWIGAGVNSLLEVISAGSGLITGKAAPDVYIQCSNKVTNRIGNLRPFVGVATLRALNCQYLPEGLTQEPLGALVTRVLYRLRFSGEQRPFDTISLIYILPLIFLVLRKGGFGDIEDAGAQIILALEFLSYHTDASSDMLVPREQILSTLILSMQKYNQHWNIVRDCLADLCRCIAPNISAQELAVLVKGAIVPQISVRTAVLQSISAEIDMSDLDFSAEIWLATHDDVEENVELGQEIWEEGGFRVHPESVLTMLPYLRSSDEQLRRAAARSLADVVKSQPASFGHMLSQLQTSYKFFAKPKVPQLDVYGMPLKTDLADAWEARNGVALAFKEIAPIFETAMLDPFLRFLIKEGPLGDINPEVRKKMIEAATAIITYRSKDKVEQLMQTFEQTLEMTNDGSETADRVHEAVIIMYGALARHLKTGEPRVPMVVDRLLETLSTPSETVQYAVAECLPPLVRASSQKMSEYVQTVLERLLNSKKYATWRGAAYGLAGIVNGKGVAALREYRIMMTLKGAIYNKKEVNQREGALLAYELFATILGRVFEPYVIQIVPQLLSSFGDSSPDVRDACLAAAKTCFASLSSYGVKQILPTLLEGLDDQQWRSKKGACDLLGAMAYLEPQELAQSLPQIIPPLSAVLNDSHKEVRLASNRSLKRFGEVISNPEIKSLVDVLLKALSDPTKFTDEALSALIKVSFVHYLDSPSLALVVRILQRGLGDRSATKRKSAQVIGSLAHLTERKDLVSHLPVLVAGLKVAIVDPVPTTRATAAKALGALVEKLSEDALPELIPDLMQTLKSDTGAGDRLGSAQALSEVLAGLGTSRLEETLPTILQNVASSKASVREGFMSLFIFLPVCFGNSFASYLSRIIPPILAGLSDDIESIRDTALRAGRLLVKNFAAKAIDLLLPELERGLADDSHRIRLSSVELVGDLLFNLTGISATTEQDEVGESAQEASASLVEALGMEKRNKVLSSLYICRCDTSGLVRTAAINVWKALVASPRSLKELIPTLTQLIIRRLGSSNMEQKVIAGNALGEVIRKAGDSVLTSLLPTLEEGLQTSTDVDTKQGICIALRELISSASPEALEDHERTLTSVVRTGLVDSDDEVREAAAEAFDSLQAVIGKKAVDQVLPHLLSLLRTDSGASNALAALLTLLTETTRSNIILPNLIPTLISSPISSFNAKALTSLSTVAGSSMTRRLPSILNSLMDNIIDCSNSQLRADLESSFDAVLLSIDPFDGLNTAMSVLLTLVKHEDHRRRAATDYHLAKFFAATKIDYSRYQQDLIRALLISFDDSDPEVVKAAWAALNELMKQLKKEEMEALVPSTRQVLQHVGVVGSHLPGFILPKGINAVLPIFLQGLMYGTVEQKVQSALGLGDICDRTSGDALKPFVTQITGPLIRVVSERSVDVKAAILLTLNNLLEKIPTFLKPFLPQLQRTFAKCLADTGSEVLRRHAARALGTLITLTPRVDPLLSELVAGARTSDVGVRNAMLKALYEVISKAGSNLSETSRSGILNLIDNEPGDHDLDMAITNAKILGALVKNLTPEASITLIKHRVMTSHYTRGSVLALNALLLESPASLTETAFAKDLQYMLCKGMSSNDIFTSNNCVLAAGKYLLLELSGNMFETLKPVFETIASSIQPVKPVDTRRLALVIVRTVCRRNPEIVRPHLAMLATPVFACVRDPVIPVKLAAEAAFLALFNVVEEGSKLFDNYIVNQELPVTQRRSMQDYFKRVVLRLGNTARERREAEGGHGGLGLTDDELDDEKEIWSVGKVDLLEGRLDD